jgi:acetolactate synthase I/II/III large subunit
MTGAEVVIRTAVAAGIEICFSNPGTTEIPLVSAFDTMPGIRPVLGLFEGVCAGAADGYGRMLRKPAMTLFHLGPGLANGIANLHNARRAATPMLNVIGEHASWHRNADAPLTMDIEALAGTVSGWKRTCKSPESLSHDTAEAIAAASRGRIAGLIVPQDYQWSECADSIVRLPEPSFDPVDSASIEAAAALLKSEKKTVLFLGGAALRKPGLDAAARIGTATGCDLLSETLPAHMERGAGIPAIDRLPYFPEAALPRLSQYQSVVLAGAREPVAFFGYKGMPGRLITANQEILSIAEGERNVLEALECLADALSAPKASDIETGTPPACASPEIPSGILTGESAGATLALLQPPDAIIVDESVTTGGPYYPLAATAPPHSLLTLTGGAIGQGMPCAVGAALACPDRPVINFQADGSAMYTIQSLWTQARESLNVTTLICANSAYQILRIEAGRMGDDPMGKNALALTDIGNPRIGWVELSKGMGIPAVSVKTSEELGEALKRALAEPGPNLIEMVLNSFDVRVSSARVRYR